MSDDIEDLISEVGNSLLNYASKEYVKIGDPADKRYENACEAIRTKFDALNQRIAELESAQRWRVVADGELPEFGTSILFYDSILEKINKGTCTALDRDKTNLQWITDDGLYYHGNRCEYITHWMPLPEPPIVYGKVCEE